MTEIKRRDFLKVLGAGTAGAGLSACGGEQTYNLIPYLVDEENIVPGIANYYASVCGECPAACGVHVKVREGRPIKVEGNPDHPVNSGALCARGQASLQGLYNPDRITGPMRRVNGQLQSISWDEAEAALVERIGALLGAGQAGRLYMMTDGAVGSFDSLIDRWLAAVGSSNRIIHDSFDLEPLREANRITFGVEAIPSYDPGAADLIISFGAEFTDTWLSPVGLARSWSRPTNGSGHKARLVHIGPRRSLTASNADEWVKLRPGAGMSVALAMAHVIVDEGRDLGRGAALRELLAPYTPDRAAKAAGDEAIAETVEHLARELAAAESSLVLPPGVELTGTNATAEHVAVNILNWVAGNVGTTVRFGPELQRRRSAGTRGLGALVSAMRAGEVDVLMVHGSDPVHALPAGLGFADALESVGTLISFASYMDETAARADLILPDHTPLESWGDSNPFAGVYGLQQPTIRPLHDTRATADMLIAVAGRLGGNAAAAITWPDFRAYMQDVWRVLKQQFDTNNSFETFWRASVERGGAWREIPVREVSLLSDVRRFAAAEPELDGTGERVLLAYPSAKYYDGRGANRPWLQELPDPTTKVVWNSWIEISDELAASMGVVTGDVLRVTSAYGVLEAPAYVSHGIHRDAIAIPMGLGHANFGRYARDRGVNPMALLAGASDTGSGGGAWLTTKVSVEPAGRREQLVIVQATHDDQDREVAEAITLAAAEEMEAHAREEIERHPDELVDAADDADPKSPYRWGMTIDTSSCIGCSACVTACYAENNVPVVGEQVCAEGREMSWLRIESYLERPHSGNGHGRSHEDEDEDDDGKLVTHVPMLCQHCGNAPCEPVCPVYATYHNPEGLNVQVYNRCVGTRYCSNNCPYKVRRFEFYQYDFPYPLNLQLNPDVTVREKGVMEKCTFCVQRINLAKSDASAEGKLVEDGEMVPACAQTCPTDAIVFGNLRDPNSRVSKLARSGRAYHVLAELNTRPAVTYLKKVARSREET